MGIMKFEVRPKHVAITWFNDYSGVIIKTPTSTLIFDPVNIELEKIQCADVIVVTHEHWDHFDAELVRKLQERTGATVVTTPFVGSQLEVPENKLTCLKAGTSITLGKVKLDALYSDHPGEQPLTFLITTDDSLKIYHTNDSRPYQGMKVIGEKHHPDITFCTVGIAPGTSPESGVKVAKLTRTRVAIPYHTDQPEMLRRFSQIMASDAPSIGVKILRKFEIYEYTR